MGNDLNMDDLFGDQPTENQRTISGPVTYLGMTFENDEARRAHFTEELRKKLQDPEFRKIEGFPIGSDEDILNLSDPPYYTACPNPFIAEYISWWRAQNQQDKEVREYRPLSHDLKTTMRDPLLNLHSYHTKVPPKALAQLILNYTSPGDIVMDVYSGSGMLAHAADLCSNGEALSNYNIHVDKENVGPRGCVISDLSVLASHIGGTHVRRMPKELPFVLKKIIEEAQSDNDWLYSCNGETLQYAVWSEFYRCDNCSGEINAWEHTVDLPGQVIVKELSCPHCGALLKTNSLQRVTTLEYDPLLRDARITTKRRLAWIVAANNNGRVERISNEADYRAVQRSQSLLNDVDIPIQELPFMHMSHERNDLPGIGYDHVHRFFASRTLYAIADLMRRFENFNCEPTVKRWLLYTLTSVLDSHLILRNRFIVDRHHPSGTTCGPLSGTLYVPVLQCEVNVYGALRKKLKKIEALPSLLPRDRGISSTQAAQGLAVPPESIDYIFIDPPFGANLNYSDLNFINESWLKVRTNRKPEAVIDNVQGKDLEVYMQLMKSGLAKCFDSLRPHGWLTVMFHNSKNSVWNAIQEAIQGAGFVVADVKVFDKGGTTIFQDSTASAVKKDLLISAYKPKLPKAPRSNNADAASFDVWGFVKEHLSMLPIFLSEADELVVPGEREPHLIFDRMVAHCVAKGINVPISAGEFYAELTTRFSERFGGIFLEYQVAEVDRKTISGRSPRQYELGVSDEGSAINWLRKTLMEKPRSFKDIHPQFVIKIGGWSKSEKVIELSSLLNQNFLCYDGKGPVPEQIHAYLSTNWKELRNLPKDDPALVAKARDRWYVPDPNKAGDLEKLREKALLKEFEEYKEVKKKLKVFRLEAVRAGFKKAWQERDYAVIVAVADKIPNNVLEEDPKLLMWYDQAVTRMEGE